MTKLALCVSVLLLMMALGETSVQTACCVNYHKHPIRSRFLETYTVQEIGGCNLKAIIFKTVNNRTLCADPKKQWVKRGMKFVEKKQRTASTKTN